jgi:hypothetical protein
LRSLNVAGNPDLAERASGLITQAEQFAEMMKQGAPSGPDAMIAGSTKTSESHSTPAQTPIHSPAARFLQGTLTSTDCSNPPSILLMVTSKGKTWKMKVEDRTHVVLIGTDEFSCSWGTKKVAINYRETAEGEGSVISLEMQ